MIKLKTCTKCNGSYRYDIKVGKGLCPACRFFLQVTVGGPDDCWLWNGKLSHDGYGAVAVVGEFLAHRASWAMANGTIPGGMHVLHCCDNRYPAGDITNRRCVNPAHLRIGTHLDNVADCIRNGRHVPAMGDKNGSRTHPEKVLRGDRHPLRVNPSLVLRGEKNGNAILTPEQVLDIRTSKESLSVVSKRHGCSKCTASAIRRRVLWKHLP